ncbi:MAG: helix-turn-helix transcriptional regulator [Eubacteriales bacterium]|nr:helix-turn-helix transcriptional regulator [Eubacteriales bacterium]
MTASEQMTYFSTLGTFDGEKNGCLVFRLKPEFGQGEMHLFEILPGIYAMCFSYGASLTAHFQQMDVTHDGFSIYKMLRGRARIDVICGYNGERKSYIVSAGDIVNYSSIDTDVITDMRMPEAGYCVGLFGFYKPGRQSLTAFGLVDEMIERFRLDERVRNGFIYRHDDEVGRLAEALDGAFHAHDAFGIRLTGLSLLRTGMRECFRREHVPIRRYDTSIIEKVEELKAYLNRTMNYCTVTEMAKRFGLSPTYTKQIFAELYGMSPYRYHLALRLARGRALLKSAEDMRIADIAACTGFSSAGKFTEAFKRRYGCTPSVFRHQVRGGCIFP